MVRPTSPANKDLISTHDHGNILSEDIMSRTPAPYQPPHNPYECHCVRCRHTWVKRIEFSRRPVRCPGCKATHWWLPAGKRGRKPIPASITVQPKSRKP